MLPRDSRLQQPNDGDCDGDGPTAGNGMPDAAAMEVDDEYDVDNIVDHRPCTIPGQYEYKLYNLHLCLGTVRHSVLSIHLLRAVPMWMGGDLVFA